MMLSDNQTFKYCGFNPSTLTQLYIKKKLSLVLKEAPMGSTYNFILSKKDQVLKGVITVVSSAKKYVAIAFGETLDEVLKKLLKQINKKFHKIKQPRFHRSNKKIHYEDFSFINSAS